MVAGSPVFTPFMVVVVDDVVEAVVIVDEVIRGVVGGVAVVDPTC